MKVLAAVIVFLVVALQTSCGSENTNESDTSVLICSGSRSYAYHSHQCKGLSQCGASVERISLATAQSLGRRPCKYCYGDSTASPTHAIRDSSSIPKDVTPIARQQCTAKTKKGTRCSRKARSGSRCWQHGG